jgi:methylenetetrahydrofolate--tRNA-(uracil-5-)-methyltransferase
MGETLATPPPTTALGALLGHITGGADASSYQPMNVNFGLFPPLDVGRTKKADRKKLYTDRARTDLMTWLALFPPHSSDGEGDRVQPAEGVANPGRREGSG